MISKNLPPFNLLRIPPSLLNGNSSPLPPSLSLRAVMNTPNRLHLQVSLLQLLLRLGSEPLGDPHHPDMLPLPLLDCHDINRLASFHRLSQLPLDRPDQILPIFDHHVMKLDHPLVPVLHHPGDLFQPSEPSLQLSSLFGVSLMPRDPFLDGFDQIVDRLDMPFRLFYPLFKFFVIFVNFSQSSVISMNGSGMLPLMAVERFVDLMVLLVPSLPLLFHEMVQIDRFRLLDLSSPFHCLQSHLLDLVELSEHLTMSLGLPELAQQRVIQMVLDLLLGQNSFLLEPLSPLTLVFLVSFAFQRPHHPIDPSVVPSEELSGFFAEFVVVERVLHLEGVQGLGDAELVDLLLPEEPGVLLVELVEHF